MKCKELFKKSTMAIAFAGLAAASLGGHAAILNTWLIPGVNQIEDTDVERIMRDGVAVTSGNFQVGDVVQTILFWNTVNDVPFSLVSPPPPAGYQLTTYAELQVANITALGGGVVSIQFTPTGSLGTDVFANVFECTVAATCGYSSTIAPATAIGKIEAGSLIASFGVGEADDFWSVVTLLDIGTAAGLGANDPQVANGNFGLSVIGSTSLPIGPNQMLGADGNLHDVVGNASAFQKGPTIDPGWLVASNTTAQFRVIPEPASLALLGLGLVGMGATLRRRKA